MRIWASLGLALALGAAAGVAAAQDAAMEKRLARAPRGAVKLFTGKDFAEWAVAGSPRAVDWLIVDEAMECKPGSGSLVTRREFADCRLHVEFSPPFMPQETGQGRGNSGVYLQGKYEVQVLDSLNNPTYKAGGCAAIYGQKDPDQHVPREPGQWQSYDIIFRAPRFGADGRKVENPRITVWWNGVKVHDNVEVTIGPTVASLGGPEVATGPILLQDHGNRVRFRNVWVKPLKIDKPDQQMGKP